MNIGNVDIEWIVREVIRRLRESETQFSTNRNGTPVAQTQRTGKSLELSEPVITLSTVEKRLDGVERLAVPTRAVVTPAVVDELKDRKIELVRGALVRSAAADCSHHEPPQSASGPGSGSGLTVAVAVDNFDTALLSRLLGESAAIVNHPPHQEHVLLEDLARDIESGGRGVLLTGAPAAAVVTANRNPQVRAAVGFNFPAVRTAVDEAGANLLAIDPHGKTAAQLAGMINEFLNRP